MSFAKEPQCKLWSVKNTFASFLLLSLLTAIISVFLEDLSGGISLQQFVQQISVEQQMIFIKASVVGTFASLISNVLLGGCLLTMIRLVINNIVHALPILPRLLMLTFFTTMLVQLGLLFIIVPGILLYFSYIVYEKKTFNQAMTRKRYFIKIALFFT